MPPFDAGAASVGGSTTVDDPGNRAPNTSSKPETGFVPPRRGERSAPPVAVDQPTPAGPAPPPAIRLLGPVRLTPSADQVVPIPARMTRNLLAVLAVQPNVALSVDRLLEALWEETPPATAATSLRVHIGKLRKLLGEHLPGVGVVHATPGYRLSCPPELIDVTRAERLMDEAAAAAPDRAVGLLNEALGLWNGDPYADVPLRHVDVERHRLDELRLNVLELRARSRAALRPPDLRFIAELERLVAIAPQREPFTGLLMRALYQLGRERDAVAAYQQLADHLAESGLVPSRALRDLDAAIVRQDPGLDRGPDTPPAPATPREGAILRSFRGAFAGRTHELALLRRLWAERRPGTGAVVTGEAGIGKSRLATELATPLIPAGATVAVGACDPDGVLPYRPFVEILRQLRAGGWDVPDPVEAVPAAAGARRPGGADQRVQFFMDVCEVLDSVSSSCPAGFLLMIEDVHWIDEESGALLRYLLGARPAPSLFTLVTARSDEPEESRTWSRLRADLARRDSQFETIELEGLAPDEVAAMVASWGPVEAAWAADIDLLVALTNGNPLLIDELAAHPPAGPGTLGPSARQHLPPVPPTVADTVRHRLRLIPAECRRTLDLAAVAGDRTPAGVLAAAAHLDLPVIYDHCAEAIDLRILVEDEGRPDVVVFKHALVRQAVLAEMSATRRRELHHRLARTLGSGSPGVDGEPAVVTAADRALAARRPAGTRRRPRWASTVDGAGALGLAGPVRAAAEAMAAGSPLGPGPVA